MSKERLFEGFAPVSDEQWRSVVERDLKGADYDKKLVWRSPTGLSVQPFYRRGDLASLEYLRHQAPGVFPYVRGNKGTDSRWTVCQPITRRDPTEANQVARKALASGAEALSFSSYVADGRLFGQRILGLSDFECLLQEVDLNRVPVHFNWGQATPQAAAYLQAYCQKTKTPLSNVTGSLGFDPLGVISSTGHAPSSPSAYWDGVASYLRESKAAFPNLKHLVIHTDIYLESGSNLTQDLAAVIGQAVEILSALTERGFAAEDLLRMMGVSAAVSTSYFMEIAFFRALRLLWADMALAYGVKNEAAQLWIHAKTCESNKTVYDPHVNILRQTTETMSAVIAGVDVVSVQPWNDVWGRTTEASERLARNTQLVIREESGLDHAVDPAAGSYYIEKLTDALAAEGWALFQELEKAGGYLAALESGTISAWVAQSRSAQDKGIASRRTSLLGTNQFPLAGENRVSDFNPDPGLELAAQALAPCPDSLAAMVKAAESGLPFSDPFLGDGRSVPALPKARRLSESYEQLRLRVDALKAAPSVYLWTFGNLAFRKARAGFCQNLYGCAGLKVVEGSGSEDVQENLAAISSSNARWIVFCSSDAEYPEKVPGLVSAIQGKVENVSLVVAGYPADAIDALKQAGVSDFVHLKTNAIEYLTQCVNLVGGEQ